MSEPSTPPASTPPGDTPPTSGATTAPAPKERRRRRTGPLIAAGVVAVALIAGGITWAVSANSGSQANAGGVVDTTATVNVGLRLQPDNLDVRKTSGIALDQVLLDNVYEGLITRGPDNTYVPRIAQKYEVSADGLTYTFTLRDNVTFHDGAKLTADDVVWSYNTVKDDDSVNGHGDFADVSKISSPDAKTVVITLTKPNLGFLWSLTGRAGIVLEKAAKNDLATTANGTGPFTIGTGGWKQGDSLTLTRNQKYYLDAPSIAAVTFIYYSDQSALDNALQAGDLDVGSTTKAVAKGYDSKAGWSVKETSSSDVWTIAFNNQKAPLNDVRVRQAIRQAIDHKAFLALDDVSGKALGSPIPDTDPGYTDLTSIDPYDPAAAKKLLADAGYANGLDLTLTIPSLYGATVSDLLTSQLREVGITLTVKQVEFPVWLDSVYKQHDYDLSFVDHAEARDFGNYANPKYYFGYDNPKVQDLYTQSQETTDLAASDKLLAQASKLVSEDAAADWLYNSSGNQIIRSTISGFPTTNTNARLDLSKVVVDSAKK